MEKWEFSSAEVVKPEAAAFDIKKLLEQILDNWAYILASLLVAIVLAFFINRYAERIYEVHTTILIKAPKESNSISEILYGQEIFGRSTVLLEDEALLFQSQTLVEKTLRELDMDVTYKQIDGFREIELYDQAPIHLYVSDSASNVPYGEVIECRIIDENTYQLQLQAPSLINKLKNFISQVPEKEDNFIGRNYRFDELVNMDGFSFMMSYNPENNNAEYGGLIHLKINNYQDMAKKFAGKVNASPQSAESYIMRLSMEIANRQKGIDFLETLVDNFIESELTLKNTIAENTIEFINSQILLMSDSLNVVEDRLEQFKKSNTNLTISDQGNNYLQTGQDFELQRNQVYLKNRYLSNLERSINENSIGEIYIPSSVGIEDPNLNKNIQELVDLQLQLKAIDPNRGANNPIVKSYQQRINVLKQGIAENIGSIKASNNIALSSINSQIGRVNATLKTLPTAERQFINIQRDYNLSEELYLFLMQKKAEAGIAKASNTVDYRIIDQADIRGKGPIKPSPTMNYILAILMGGALPLGLILLVNLLNNKVNSKEHLLSLSSIPYLGMVARSNGKVKLIDNENMRSEVSETFRTVRSNLRYMMGDDEEGKIFLLTSFISAEGKSFCANNLAYIFSNFGKKVVLINADMRKPNDYDAFDVVDNVGLSDFLAGIATKDEIICRSKFPNLHIVTSGGIPPNPSELLIGGRIKELLNLLREDYDYIILDTPPVGILADGLELMNESDVNILVVRQNYTDKRALQEYNEIYVKNKIQNLALLFNGVNVKKSAYGYKYNYYYQQQNKKKKTWSLW